MLCTARHLATAARLGERVRSFEFFGRKINIDISPRQAAGSWGASQHEPNDDHDLDTPVGLVVWTSALVVCGLLERNLLPPAVPTFPFSQEQLILEVGSGCGLAGLACAAGPNLTCCASCGTCLNDGNRVTAGATCSMLYASAQTAGLTLTRYHLYRRSLCCCHRW